MICKPPALAFQLTLAVTYDDPAQLAAGGVRVNFVVTGR
jgi:hypothetical protein